MLFSSFREVILNNEAGKPIKVLQTGIWQHAFTWQPMPIHHHHHHQGTVWRLPCAPQGAKMKDDHAWKAKRSKLWARRSVGRSECWGNNPDCFSIQSLTETTEQMTNTTQGSAVLGIKSQLIQLSANLFSRLTTLNICYLLISMYGILIPSRFDSPRN